MSDVVRVHMLCLCVFTLALLLSGNIIVVCRHFQYSLNSLNGTL